MHSHPKDTLKRQDSGGSATGEKLVQWGGKGTATDRDLGFQHTIQKVLDQSETDLMLCVPEVL
ncbi:MAG: hypothetical protein DMG23_10915 [Acidobacteria bacterium]|nr:MAG: hypothetical protein DMG23_10915 [Acidobacteriota bacterium]